jgi:predicted NBD/HSP70 family sugar kinase
LPRSDEHSHFEEIADSLAGGSGKAASVLSRPLVAEVLSRVAVRTPPVATRVEIGSGAMLRAAVPLSEGSVSKAVASLVGHELLVEGPPAPEHHRRVGRPGATLRLAEHRWFTVGVHVAQDGGRPVEVTAVAVPIDNHAVLATATRTIAESDDTTDVAGWPMAAVVEATVEVVHVLVEDPDVERRVERGWLPLLGVCVALGLRVHDGAVLAPAGDTLRAFELRRALVAALGIPVIVENDVNVLAVRETYDQRVHRDFALVLVADNGIRAAVAIDGRVRRGAQGMAGEIGSLDVPGPAGGHSPWPSSVDFQASPARMRKALGVAALVPAELATERAQQVLIEGGRSLGGGLAALVRVVDPAQVRIIAPSVLRDGPGRRYLDEAGEVLTATYAGLGRRAAVQPDIDPDDPRPDRLARAAGIRVLAEFIDHLSGIDGCPPREHSVPSWLASGRAAAVGGALGLLIGPMVPMVPVAAAYAGARLAASRRRTALARRVRLPSR